MAAPLEQAIECNDGDHAANSGPSELSPTMRLTTFSQRRGRKIVSSAPISSASSCELATQGGVQAANGLSTVWITSTRITSAREQTEPILLRASWSASDSFSATIISEREGASSLGLWK